MYMIAYVDLVSIRLFKVFSVLVILLKKKNPLNVFSIF